MRRWLFQSPARLWTTVAASAAAGLLIALGFVTIRIADIVDGLAPQPGEQVAAPTPTLLPDQQLAGENPDLALLEDAAAPSAVGPGDPRPVAADVVRAWLAGEELSADQVAVGLVHELGHDHGGDHAGDEITGEPVVTLLTANTARVEVPFTDGLVVLDLSSASGAWTVVGIEEL